MKKIISEMKIEYENLNKLNSKFNTLFLTSLDEFVKKDKFVLGNNVKIFEDSFSQYCGTNLYGIGVASGYDALILSLDTLSLPEGSEIIVPSNTYIATILSILKLGFKPILVEPDIKTYNIDVTKIESYISDKTKAIMCVHLYGKMCDMDELMDICKKHNLFLIEDASQSHGSEYKNKKSGSFGDLSAFSLYPTKNLGALGDAGIIVTNNESYYDKLQYLRNYGSKIKYYNEYVGYNSRLDELQAKFLSIKLKHLDEIINHKINLSKIYFDNLKSDFILPIKEKNKKDTFHIFNIRHEKRDDIKTFLEKNNIITEIHYPVSPNKQKCMLNQNLGEYPISEEIHRTTLSLPISYIHSEDDVYRVVETLNKF
jgi:dTDP-4-amino-4,6-dideoxygalactose transaminase